MYEGTYGTKVNLNGHTVRCAEELILSHDENLSLDFETAEELIQAQRGEEYWAELERRVNEALECGDLCYCHD